MTPVQILMLVFGIILAIAGGIVAWIELNAISIDSRKFYLRGYGHYVPLCDGKACASGQQPNPSPWLDAKGGVGVNGCKALVKQYGDRVGAWDVTGDDCHIFDKATMNAKNLMYSPAGANEGTSWRAYDTNMFGRLMGGVL